MFNVPHHDPHHRNRPRRLAPPAGCGQRSARRRPQSVPPDAKTRERIALAVAQANGCDYCLSAHTYLGLNLAKIDSTEIALNRAGSSQDPKAAAAVQFAVKVVETRGKISPHDLAAVKAAGFSEAQVIEIVGVVAVNVLTNYVNNVAETDIDFPVVRAAQAA
jgi:uncharacterized peroxidase-related enzyme